MPLWMAYLESSSIPKPIWRGNGSSWRRTARYGSDCPRVLGATGPTSAGTRWRATSRSSLGTSSSRLRRAIHERIRWRGCRGSPPSPVGRLGRECSPKSVGVGWTWRLLSPTRLLPVPRVDRRRHEASSDYGASGMDAVSAPPLESIAEFRLDPERDVRVSLPHGAIL